MRVASINLEGTKHLPEQLAWLQALQPDVWCATECFRVSLPQFERLGYTSSFVPYAQVTEENKYNIELLGDWGVAIFSRLPVQWTKTHTYKGDPYVLPVFSEPNSGNRLVHLAEVEENGRTFTIAVTHLTWTPNGEATDEQRRDTTKLLKALEPYPSLLLCGDFNAPRGKETWSRLAEKYHDNVPPEVTSTIDPGKHYSGGLEIVVDGMFTTPDLRLTNVQVHTGVSDHCGLSAVLARDY